MRGGLVLTLVLGLFLYGCCGPTQVAEDTITGSTAPTDGTTPSVPTGGTGPSVPADGTGTGDTTPEPSGNGELDFSGLDFAGVMALGVPVQCDMTMLDSSGQTATIKMYAINEDNLRQEIVGGSVAQSGCQKVIVIIKPDGQYLGCEGTSMFGPSCDWLKLPSGGAADEGAVGFDMPAVADLPSGQISCLPWIPDNSKFNTPGTACTMEEMMQGMMGGYNQ